MYHLATYFVCLKRRYIVGVGYDVLEPTPTAYDAIPQCTPTAVGYYVSTEGLSVYLYPV